MTKNSKIVFLTDLIEQRLRKFNIDPNYNSLSESFSNFKPPGLLPAVEYDTGNNHIAYYDYKVEDPSKFSPDTESWNNGWSFRNDGVDIGATMINGEKKYFVGWIEDNEWMKTHSGEWHQDTFAEAPATNVAKPNARTESD